LVRIAILADTHGFADNRILDLVATCDIAVHGGDIGNAAVLAALQRRTDRVVAVRGNNDVPPKWPEEEGDLLAGLPEVAELSLPAGSLVIIHGHQTPAKSRHERLRRRFPLARAVVYGHSHRLLTDLGAEPWILNPGAAGRARTFGGPSCIVLTASQRGWTLEAKRFEPTRKSAKRTCAQPGVPG
jgi:putative phosphoesterase